MKEILYDWHGWNAKLFHAINNIHAGDLYDRFMLLGTNLANRSNFPFYLAAFIIWGLISISMHKNNYKIFRALWANIVIVFILSFILDNLFLEWAKHYFAFPRPFVELEPNSFRTIGKPMEETQHHLSFPSGHASFAMLVSASIWPALRPGPRILALMFVVWVCWSRIALGVHYPADLLAGALSCLVIVLLVRHIVNKFPAVSSEIGEKMIENSVDTNTN